MTLNVVIILQLLNNSPESAHLLAGTSPADDSVIGTNLYYDAGDKTLTWSVASPLPDQPGFRKFISEPVEFPNGQFSLTVTYDPEDDTGDILLDDISILASSEGEGETHGGIAGINEIGWQGETAEMLLLGLTMTSGDTTYTYDCTQESEEKPDCVEVPGKEPDAPPLTFELGRWGEYPPEVDDWENLWTPEFSATTSASFPEFANTELTWTPEFSATTSASFPEFANTELTWTPEFSATTSASFPEFANTELTWTPEFSATTSASFPEFGYTEPEYNTYL